MEYNCYFIYFSGWCDGACNGYFFRLDENNNSPAADVAFYSKLDAQNQHFLETSYEGKCKKRLEYVNINKMSKYAYFESELAADI